MRYYLRQDGNTLSQEYTDAGRWVLADAANRRDAAAASYRLVAIDPVPRLGGVPSLWLLTRAIRLGKDRCEILRNMVEGLVVAGLPREYVQLLIHGCGEEPEHYVPSN